MTSFLVHMLRTSAERNPRAEVVLHRERRITYGEMWSNVLRVAAFLREHGLEKGQRVALLLENSPEYIAAYYGALAAGGVAVALNSAAKMRDLANWLQHSGAAWLIVDAKHPEFSQITARYDGVGLRLVLVGDGNAPEPSHAHSWDDVLTTTPRVDALLDAAEEDVAAIIYTSGTTGRPKGVTLSHGNLSSNVASILQYLKLASMDRCLNILPFYYSYGNSVLHTHLAVGGSLVLENSLAYPHKILERMAKEKVTGFSGVPSTYSLLLNRTRLSDYDLSALRYMTQAGGAMAPAQIKRLKEELGHVDFYVMYGQTEATARLTYLPAEKLFDKLGSVGIPIPGVEILICDEHGSPVLDGVAGEIHARGNNVMLGYWNDPEASRHVLRNGWLKTGDIARRDQDGYFYIEGRRSDMIKSGAHRINPKEIEEVIAELDAVAEVAVVGVSDEILGQTIKAVIVPRVGAELSAMAVQAYCHKNLAAYKIPKHIEFVTELPKTASGKVKRYLLSDQNALNQELSL